ncbi:MAG: LysR substrate-binding domain-containing protein [Rhodanobacter sp.]|uniref:LysR family transcriptional regulator, regulator of gene expression of beta-lactamase n=1 Tax=Pollutimonas bauzanensis TaxID=658167 RepID=A0A1M5ZNM8_9BURK|nr:LysR substrate-binding domain-containing protein [Pollutimonas bauzanensis]SHI25802.1 LysR family transcriptional regulator, regulator of gene expression of beta-lactamase [Pollutimonas bauzanensis]
MSNAQTRILSRIPSLRSLLVFDVAARHLNLVRAAEELCVSQGALSRQLKSLEGHLGLALFERGPRGLKFTPEGELLYDFTSRAFSLVSEGIHRLGLQPERSTLVVSAARSFAQRVLASRLVSFTAAYPHIELHLDVHRYYADLETSGADISIRLGRGDWEGYQIQPLTRDRLVPVCAPSVASFIEKEGLVPGHIPLLCSQERPYVEHWNASVPARAIAKEGRMCLIFNDSSTLLSALESGLGITVTRSSLIEDALEQGILIRPFDEELVDALDYYAVCSQRSTHKLAVRQFMDWLRSAFSPEAQDNR